MAVGRTFVAVAALGAAVAALWLHGPALLITAIAGFAAHSFRSGGVRRTLRDSLPLAMFLGFIAVLQLASGSAGWELPLRALAVFWFAAVAFGVLPWNQLVVLARPRSPFFSVVLFLLFLRHFALVLRDEVRRVLQARRLCVRYRFGAGSFRSLVWAVVALFRRALVRAERFYAAQWLGGIVP
jgi:hypothetical protein